MKDNTAVIVSQEDIMKNRYDPWHGRAAAIIHRGRKISRQRAKINELVTQITARDEEIEQLEVAYERMEAERNKYLDKANNLRLVAQANKEAAEKARAEAEELQHTIGNLQQQMQYFTEFHVPDLKAEIERLKAQLEAAVTVPY